MILLLERPIILPPTLMPLFSVISLGSQNKMPRFYMVFSIHLDTRKHMSTWDWSPQPVSMWIPRSLSKPLPLERDCTWLTPLLYFLHSEASLPHKPGSKGVKAIGLGFVFSAWVFSEMFMCIHTKIEKKRLFKKIHLKSLNTLRRLIEVQKWWQPPKRTWFHDPIMLLTLKGKKN
jgi:hypothetical protein